MNEATAIAVLAIAGTIVGGAFTAVVALLVRLNSRIRKLEHRDRLSWLYIRALINHAYIHNALPLPEPPDGWLGDTEE